MAARESTSDRETAADSVLFQGSSKGAGSSADTQKWVREARKEFHYPRGRIQRVPRPSIGLQFLLRILPSFFLPSLLSSAPTAQPTARNTSFPLSASFSRPSRFLGAALDPPSLRQPFVPFEVDAATSR